MKFIERILGPVMGAIMAAAVVNPCQAQDQTAVVHLKSGQTRSGTVHSVSRSDLKLRIPGSDSTVGFAYKDIQHIEFPAPEVWREAMRTFYGGDYAAAARELEAIATSRDKRALFHPAPGNFVTLANRRLIDCYQRLIQPEKLGAVVTRMDWGQLSAAEREAEVTAEAWAASGVKDWQKAATLIAEADAALSPEDPRRGELAYLRGLAAEDQGDTGSAVLAFAKVYGPYPGANRRLAANALERAATLLGKDPARKPELVALLQIYAQSFGNGKLWESAPAPLQDLLNQP